MISLQQSHLPESAEILDILNKIEFEGLFYSHDKLAQLQVSDSPLPPLSGGCGGAGGGDALTHRSWTPGGLHLSSISGAGSPG